MEVTKWLNFGIACHELVSLDFRCGSTRDQRHPLPKRPYLGVQPKKSRRKRTSALHKTGRLQFFGAHARLAEPGAFAAYLAPLRKIKWGVCAKRVRAGATPPVRRTRIWRNWGRARLSLAL